MLRSAMIAAIAVIAFVQCVLAGEQRARIGRAYDKTSGVLIYEERHLETFSEGSLLADQVSYTDPAGKVFASKRVDFGDNPFLPDFTFNNERTGHTEALLHPGTGLVEVRFRDRAEGALRTRRLDTPPDAVADAGFDRFIESHWDELSAGTSLVRRFLVPSRLEFMDWRVQRIDDGATRAEPGTVRFALEIDSALLRIVVPSITVVYDRANRRLLRYEGLSNLRDDSGDNYRVRIEFEYLTQVASGPETGAESDNAPHMDRAAAPPKSSHLHQLPLL